MKKVNVKELTEALNKFRIDSKDRVFTRAEALNAFHALGFNKAIAQDILRFMSFEQMGTARLYQFNKEPIYEGRVKALYKKDQSSSAKYYSDKKEKTAEEEALELLREKGYKVQRVIGFDEARFKAEHPELYKQYLKYEVL